MSSFDHEFEVVFGEEEEEASVLVEVEITYGGCPPNTAGHPDNWYPGEGAEFECKFFLVLGGKAEEIDREEAERLTGEDIDKILEEKACEYLKEPDYDGPDYDEDERDYEICDDYYDGR